MSKRQLHSLCKNLSSSVFLDSESKPKSSGFSILSAEPVKLIQATQQNHSPQLIKEIKELETFAELQSTLATQNSQNDIKELASLPFTSGLIGFLSYTFGENLQVKQDGLCKQKRDRNSDLPCIHIGFYTWSYILNHHTQQGYLTFSPMCKQTTRNKILKLIDNNSQGEYNKKTKALNKHTWLKSQAFKSYNEQFSKIKEYIDSGDCYQVNLTQMFESNTAESAVDLYFETRNHTQTPYSCFLSFNEHQSLLSFSPEQFISIKNRVIESKPIKGTIANDGSHDSLSILLHSKKNQAENVMIVDLIRNDLGRVCQTSSIHVPELFKLESFNNVHHLVSHIQGHLKEGISELDAFLSCFPGGSITGAPKIRSMEIINELEQDSRNAYCGSVFYLNQNGNFDSNILIRTVVKNKDALFCWAGGGIVADSEVLDEYQESLTKVVNITGITG